MNNPVKIKLVGSDSNAFAILGLWKREAKAQGWSKQDIDEVFKEAMSGDYNHLLSTIVKHSEDISDCEEEEEWEWDEEEEDE